MMCRRKEQEQAWLMLVSLPKFRKPNKRSAGSRGGGRFGGGALSYTCGSWAGPLAGIPPPHSLRQLSE